MPQTLMGVVRLTASPSTIVARILPLDDRELFNPCWRKFTLGTGTQPALELVMVTRPALPPQNYTRIFLYAVPGSPSGQYISNTFPDPGNWNPGNNRVDVVGAGQLGHPTSAPNLAEEEPGPFVPGPSQGGGGGGGGGAFAWATNIPATFPVGYTVWSGTTVASSNYTCVWGSSQFSSPTTGPGVVYAGIASGGQYSSPGSGGSLFYPQGFAGGNGGNGNMGGGGGGGGSAGPAGIGAAATAATSTTFGSGGSANAGASAGGTTGGAAGVSGIEWGIAGVGGGGAGSLISSGVGGAGGLYGGGGGGGGGGSGAIAGVGGDGLIVLTYVPLYKTQAQVMA